MDDRHAASSEQMERALWGCFGVFLLMLSALGLLGALVVRGAL